MSPREGLTPTPEPMSINRTIDVLADPAKMVTLLALGTFPPGEGVSFINLANRCNDLQGPYKTRDIPKASVIKHCKLTLAPAGVINFAGEIVPDGKTAHAVSLTEKGATDGLAIAGAGLGLQLEAPFEGFLERSMGVRADTTRDNPRPQIYEKIVQDGPSAVMALARFAGIGPARTTNFVQRLEEDGVLDHRSLIDAANRKYLLAKGDFPNKAGPLTSVILGAALTLRAQKREVVSGQDILDEVSREQPGIPESTARQALLDWMFYKPHRKGLIRPVREPGSAQSEVSITPEFEPHIKKMLDVRKLLASDDQEARDFQEECRKNALEIAKTPEFVAQVLGYRSSFMAKGTPSEWVQVAERVYLANILDDVKLPLEELYEETMRQRDERISLKHFCAHILASPSLLLRRQPIQREGTRLAKYVISRHVAAEE